MRGGGGAGGKKRGGGGQQASTGGSTSPRAGAGQQAGGSGGLLQALKLPLAASRGAQGAAQHADFDAREARGSDEHVHLVAVVGVDAVVLHARQAGHQRLLGADVQVVVQPPVHRAHLARRVEQALQGVGGGGGREGGVQGVSEYVGKLGREGGREQAGRQGGRRQRRERVGAKRAHPRTHTHEQAHLQDVVEDDGGAQSHAAAVDRAGGGL